MLNRNCLREFRSTSAKFHGKEYVAVLTGRAELLLSGYYLCGNYPQFVNTIGVSVL